MYVVAIFFVFIVFGGIIVNTLKVSVFVRKDLLSILLLLNGAVVDKHVEKIKDEKIKASNYTCQLYGIRIALLHVRSYFEHNGYVDAVNFEISNSTIQKWIDKCYSKEQYQGEFVEMMTLLNELPICYDFSVIPQPIAYKYADEKYITNKATVSGLDID